MSMVQDAVESNVIEPIWSNFYVSSVFIDQRYHPLDTQPSGCCSCRDADTDLSGG